CGGGFDERGEVALREIPDVVVVLEDAAERARDDLRVQRVLVELDERLRPVDRLGHAGSLQETPSAERLDEARDLLGQARAGLGDPRVDDPDLLLEAGMLDVEVEIAAWGRVEDLAAAM